MTDPELAACQFAKREWRAKALEKTLEVERLEGDNRRCSRRMVRGEKLLTWVQNEADLSGQMELAAAIRAYLGEI